MAENDYDFSDHQQEPKDDLLNKIMEGATKQGELAQEVKDADAALKKAKKKHLDHEQVVMPQLMQDAKLDDFTRDGKKIEILEKIRVGVPADDDERKRLAYKWLEENGEGRLVKTAFTLEFDNMDKDAIEQFKILLNERGLEFEFKRSHNPNSLTATIGKKMKNGDDVPQQTFGVFRQKFCKITKAKKK